MFHQTIAKIHLDHIQYNIEEIRKVIGLDKKIMIPVKANAYGHGAIAVSKLAERIGVEWLGVASVPEGVQLRDANIQLPILKFSPAFPEEMEMAIENRMTLTVCDIENIKVLESISSKMNRKIDVHLKVDTGMGRIGIAPEETIAYAEFLEDQCEHLFLDGIYTHLPVSDEADLEYTKTQIHQFQKLVDAVNQKINRRINVAHCSNSGGVLAHPEGWMDLVRPGIMLYGYYPSNETPQDIPLKSGLSFLTKVSFLKKVVKGTSIGYGRTWIAPQDTWIATIQVGYADGYNRLLSNQGRVLINGKSYPVVGRVCMDQTMVDVGSITDVRVGDDVILIGKSGNEEVSCYEWAEKLNTITYEVTSQISPRVERVYESLIVKI